MKSRTIAIAGTIAALTFTAAPVAAVAATSPHARQTIELRTDRSRDANGVQHVDKSFEQSKDRGDSPRDYSPDLRDQ
jgi:hypothetical protein